MIRKTIKAYFTLCRVSNLPTVWTNVLAALVLAGTGFAWSDGALLVLSLSLLYTGGMCLNDLVDRDSDRVTQPSRPLPSGAIRAGDAGIFTVLQFAAALLILVSAYSLKTVMAGLMLLAAITAYDWFHKAHPATVLLMAFCRFMIFIVVSFAVSGGAGRAVVIGGGTQFLYVLCITVVARIENSRQTPYSFPLIPRMLAGISLLDGLLMSLFSSWYLMIAGVAGALLTHAGQKYVRGD